MEGSGFFDGLETPIYCDDYIDMVEGSGIDTDTGPTILPKTKTSLPHTDVEHLIEGSGFEIDTAAGIPPAKTTSLPITTEKEDSGGFFFSSIFSDDPEAQGTRMPTFGKRIFLYGTCYIYSNIHLFEYLSLYNDYYGKHFSVYFTMLLSVI